MGSRKNRPSDGSGKRVEQVDGTGVPRSTSFLCRAMSPEVPVVSVVVPTYQHAAYIEQCLEGILMQRTSFPVEILVGEDESTDGTREICERYAEAHPDRIRLFLGKRSEVIRINGRPTGRANFMRLWNGTRGRYIALCEGDDYWTDPMKLQKQVDLMESDPACSMCFHRAMLLKKGEEEHHPIPAEVDLANVQVEDLLRTYNFVTTASVLYRDTVLPLPRYMWKVPFADLSLHMHAASKGRIRGMADVMSVYRISDRGVWSRLSDVQQQRSLLQFYRIMGPHLSGPQRAIVASKRAELLERMAHARFPVNPRRKWLHLRYIRFSQYLSAMAYKYR